MLKPPAVSLGQYVHVGDILGYVGSTGHSSGPHAHVELTSGRPTSFRQYPSRAPLSWIKKNYLDPNVLVKNGLPCDVTFYGNRFLQPVGMGLHLGVDLNSMSDLGKPIKSPCNGRVQFAEGVNWVRTALGRLIPSVYNAGFGNHVWIEVDEAKPGF